MRVLHRWLAVGIVCSLLVPATGADAADPRIERSRAELRQARRTAASASASLDHAAAAYEQAHAHLQRLATEEARTRSDVAAAHRRVVRADAEVRDRVVTLYKHPELRFEAIEQAVLAPDLGETLHQLELVDQLARHGAQVVARVGRSAGRVQAAERDYRLVTAGVRDAVRERRERAADLGEALARARAGVTRADDALATAERTVAAERAATSRRRELAARAKIADGGGPLPPVDGKVCPVGAPNAFSDSWGAPRSGGRTHEGADMFAAYGTPLYAVEAGTIRTSDNTLGGVSIHLDGDSGDSYYYAHLSKRIVVTGDRVEPGTVVGAVGNSGNARTTPPHLHFEYHPGGGDAVNPTPLATALCRS